MTQTTADRECGADDIFLPAYADEDLEASAGSPRYMPTFTCSVPMCATGGGCGTWTGTGLTLSVDPSR